MEIERMKTANVLLVVGAVATLSLVGCDQKSNPVTKAADATKAAADKATTAAKDATKGAVDASKDAVKGAADAAKDATKGAVDAGKDAVKGAADAAKDATKGVTDAAAKALEAAKGEGTKWLTDTVEKQWPGMKTELTNLGGKVAGIKDAAVKTKAEGLVKDLQGQIPAVEKMVGDLKNFKDGDYTKLFGEVKKAWDGFGGKLGDLKKLIPAG
jgi:hypothetical protein